MFRHAALVADAVPEPYSAPVVHKSLPARPPAYAHGEAVAPYVREYHPAPYPKQPAPAPGYVPYRPAPHRDLPYEPVHLGGVPYASSSSAVEHHALAYGHPGGIAFDSYPPPSRPVYGYPGYSR